MPMRSSTLKCQPSLQLQQPAHAAARLRIHSLRSAACSMRCIIQQHRPLACPPLHQYLLVASGRSPGHTCALWCDTNASNPQPRPTAWQSPQIKHGLQLRSCRLLQRGGVAAPHGALHKKCSHSSGASHNTFHITEQSSRHHRAITGTEAGHRHQRQQWQHVPHAAASSRGLLPACLHVCVQHTTAARARARATHVQPPRHAHILTATCSHPSRPASLHLAGYLLVVHVPDGHALVQVVLHTSGG
jgi:hypothetical protein